MKEELSVAEALSIKKRYQEKLKTVASLGRVRKFSYQDMEGYDVFDISNSMKLAVAQQVADCRASSKQEVLSFLAERAKYDDFDLLSYFNYFYPEAIVERLAHIDDEDPNRLTLAKALLSQTPSTLKDSVLKQENTYSFLNYCIDAMDNPATYWESVYKRLAINRP